MADGTSFDIYFDAQRWWHSSRNIRPWITEHMVEMTTSLLHRYNSGFHSSYLKHIEQANSIIHKNTRIISYINEGRLVSAKTKVSSPPFSLPIAFLSLNQW